MHGDSLCLSHFPLMGSKEVSVQIGDFICFPSLALSSESWTDREAKTGATCV